MDKKKVIKEISVFQKNTITDYLGIKITDYGDNYICGEMPVDDRTKQPYGLLHGGASVVFAETLGSIGAGMNIDYKKKISCWYRNQCQSYTIYKRGIGLWASRAI